MESEEERSKTHPMKLLGRVFIGLLALTIITRIIAGPCFGFNLISMVGFICLLYHLFFGIIIYYPGSTFFTIEENQAKSKIGYRVLAIFKGVLVAVIIYTYSGIFSLNPYSFGMTAFIVPLTLIYLLLELVLSKLSGDKVDFKTEFIGNSCGFGSLAYAPRKLHKPQLSSCGVA